MNATLLMRMSRWEKIRTQFSEVEKDRLNAAICGEVICPRGVTLDCEKLGPELERKIREAKEA